MDFAGWFTLLTLAGLVGALVSGKMGADTAMLAALTALIVAGVVEPARALAGFANPAVITIASLLVVAAGLRETGAMEMLATRLLGRPRTLMGAQVRLMAPVALMSSVMNNTAIVAIYLPIVTTWARKLRISPSKLYMPLSFASILGGACTLIGTSSNIVVNDLYVQHFETHAAEMAAMGLTAPSVAKQFWWVAIVGAPAVVLGIGLIAVTSRWLLPGRIDPMSDETDARRYMVETIVEPGGPMEGRTIEQAELRSLPGLFLAEIEREGDVLPAVGPDEVLRGGDRLVFAGVVESVVDLLKMRGLSPATDQVSKIDADRRDRTIVEAVVSANSSLVGKTVRQSQFRTRFNAAIVALHRGGRRLGGKIGSITIQPGDTLLLSTHHGFVTAFRNSNQFYLISSVEDAREVRYERAWVALSIVGLLVAALTVVPLVRMVWDAQWLGAVHLKPVTAALGAAMLMVLTRCCTGTLARRSLNLQVLIVIAAAIGVGAALEATGVAQLLGGWLYALVGGLDGRLMLGALSLVVALVSQLVTNKGAAVLLFPVAMDLAGRMQISPEPVVLTLMATTACSFLTPVGFVTNLMVWGPGGYRFSDFVRLGLPLTVLVAILCATLAPAALPLHG